MNKIEVPFIFKVNQVVLRNYNKWDKIVDNLKKELVQANESFN